VEKKELKVPTDLGIHSRQRFMALVGSNVNNRKVLVSLKKKNYMT